MCIRNIFKATLFLVLMTKKIAVLYKVFLILFGLFLFLLMLEFGLRIANYSPHWFVSGSNELERGSIPFNLVKLSSNPDIKFEHRPGVSYVTYLGFSINYTINERGFRDRVYSKRKSENTFRLIVLGDSLTYGIGVKEEETYPKVLERMLNDNSDTNFEVLNFGVGGYNTAQEIAQFKEYGVKYNPDLVIVGYFMNDPYNVTGIDIVKMAKGELREEKCYLNMLFYVRIPCLLKKSLTKFRALLFINDLIKQVRNYGTEDKLMRVNKDPYLMGLVYSKLAELRAIVTKEGGTVVFVVIPVLEKFDDKEWLGIYKQIEGNATTRGLSVVNVLLYYNGRDPKSLRAMEQDVSHPNTLGHKLIAQAIYEKLISEDLIPK